jgi:hypothetical protein
LRSAFFQQVVRFLLQCRDGFEFLEELPNDLRVLDRESPE